LPTVEFRCQHPARQGGVALPFDAYGLLDRPGLLQQRIEVGGYPLDSGCPYM
jgi:hypothetical protein